MSATLRGADDLRARLKALTKNVVKPTLRTWSEEAVKIGRSDVAGMSMPYAKGTLLSSIDVRRTSTGRVSNSGGKAVVDASYHAYFVDAGVKPHSLKARASTTKRRAAEGRTIFAPRARKHPGYRKRPFRAHMTTEAYRRIRPIDKIVDAWNGGA